MSGIEWNLKVQYYIHTFLSSAPLLNELDAVHSSISQFPKIQLNIILPFKPGTFKLPLSLRFLQQNPECSIKIHSKIKQRAACASPQI
jgi:hypothetical protein